MIQMSLSLLAQVVAGEYRGPADASFTGVAIDSRTSAPENLFIALRGPRHDAHDFITPVLAATVLLVDQPVNDARPTVRVADTATALARLATYWRGCCTARFVALTGSNGKTTTKEMLRTLLTASGTVQATQGNLNNHLGVPLTLLSLDPATRYAVIEMGANHAGEIACLTEWVRPEVALITNAGRAHIEGFGSLAGVARAKGEIYGGLPAQGGMAILNLDDAFAAYWASLNEQRRCVGFSLSGRGEVQGRWQADQPLVLCVDGAEACLALPDLSRHLAQNVLAAVAVGHALGLPLPIMVEGLRHWRPVASRQQLWQHPSGARIWDDTYNANPESVVAALELLARHAGPTLLVLGDMLELGAQALQWHAEMGARAREVGIHHLLAVGTLTPAAVEAFGEGGRWFASHQELAVTVHECLSADVGVLIKGSRGQHMEQVLNELGRLGATQGDAHAAVVV